MAILATCMGRNSLIARNLSGSFGARDGASLVPLEQHELRDVLAGSGAGFWANVSPEVPYPRWGQAEEAPLGSPMKVPTVLYNGYGEFVADLYKAWRASRCSCEGCGAQGGLDRRLSRRRRVRPSGLLTASDG
jgi:hypothetical protein